MSFLASVAPALAVYVDAEAFGQLRDLIAFHPVANRAGFTRRTAAARARPFPWKLAVGLGDPAAIIAARAVPHRLE
jgi:hypothetical protein